MERHRNDFTKKNLQIEWSRLIEEKVSLFKFRRLISHFHFLALIFSGCSRSSSSLAYLNCLHLKTLMSDKQTSKLLGLKCKLGFKESLSAFLN